MNSGSSEQFSNSVSSVSNSDNYPDSYSSSGKSVFLWLILILLIGIGVAVFLWLGLSLFQTTPTPSPPVSCSGNITQLPDVSNTTQFMACCSLDGDSTNQRFYDSVNDWTVLPLSSSEIPSSALVCLEFCSNLSLPSTCTNPSPAYTQCLAKLTPQNCTDPSLPAATQGSTPLYAVGRGLVSCYPCNN